MGSRTEGVGRGVNWGALSNIASIIARSGEVQANMFANIGPTIRQNIERNIISEKEQKRYDEEKRLDEQRRAEEQKRYETQLGITKRQISMQEQNAREARSEKQWDRAIEAMNMARGIAPTGRRAATRGAVSGTTRTSKTPEEIEADADRTMLSDMMRQSTLMESLGQHDKAERLRQAAMMRVQESWGPALSKFVNGGPGPLDMGDVGGPGSSMVIGPNGRPVVDISQLDDMQGAAQQPAQPAQAVPQAPEVGAAPQAGRASGGYRSIANMETSLTPPAQMSPSMSMPEDLNAPWSIIDSMQRNPEVMFDILGKQAKFEVDQAQSDYAYWREELRKAKSTREKQEAMASMNKAEAVMNSAVNQQTSVLYRVDAAKKALSEQKWRTGVEAYRDTTAYEPLMNYYNQFQAGNAEMTFQKGLEMAQKDLGGEISTKWGGIEKDAVKRVIDFSGRMQENIQMYDSGSSEQSDAEMKKNIKVHQQKWAGELGSFMRTMNDEELKAVAVSPKVSSEIANIAIGILREDRGYTGELQPGSSDLPSEGMMDFKVFPRRAELEVAARNPNSPEYKRLKADYDKWRGAPTGPEAENGQQGNQAQAAKVIGKDQAAEMAGVKTPAQEREAAASSLKMGREKDIALHARRGYEYKMKPGEKFWESMTPDERKSAIKKMESFGSRFSVLTQASMGGYPMSELERIYVETNGGDPEEMKRLGYLVYLPGEAK